MRQTCRFFLTHHSTLSCSRSTALTMYSRSKRGEVASRIFAGFSRKKVSLIFSSHNARAVLVRPQWNRERLQGIARRFSADSKYLYWLMVGDLLTAARSALAFAQAAGATLLRVLKRIPSGVFRRGEGSLVDSAHGGLLTHYCTPSRVISELDALHFRPERILGDDYPRPSHPYVDGLVLLRIRQILREVNRTCDSSCSREIPEDANLRQQWNALVQRVDQPQVFYTYEWSLAVHRAYHSTLRPCFFWLMTSVNLCAESRRLPPAWKGACLFFAPLPATIAIFSACRNINLPSSRRCWPS